MHPSMWLKQMWARGGIHWSYWLLQAGMTWGQWPTVCASCSDVEQLSFWCQVGAICLKVLPILRVPLSGLVQHQACACDQMASHDSPSMPSCLLSPQIAGAGQHCSFKTIPHWDGWFQNHKVAHTKLLSLCGVKMHYFLSNAACRCFGLVWTTPGSAPHPLLQKSPTEIGLIGPDTT